MATLTYVYQDSSMIVGPLSVKAEPHAYDLCEEHATSITAPQGWDVIRLQTDYRPAEPSHDDLTALADAVLEASRRPKPYVPPASRRPARPVTHREEPARPQLRLIHGAAQENNNVETTGDAHE